MKKIILVGVLGTIILSGVALAAPGDDIGTPFIPPMETLNTNDGDGSSEDKSPIVIGISTGIIGYDSSSIDKFTENAFGFDTSVDNSLGRAAPLRLKIGSYTNWGEKSVIGYFVGYQGISFERSSGVLSDAELSPYSSDTGNAEMDGIGIEVDYIYKTLPNFGFGPSVQAYSSAGQACQDRVEYGDGSIIPAKCYKIRGVSLDLALALRYYTKGGFEPYITYTYSRANIRYRSFTGSGFIVGLNYDFSR